MKPYAPEMRRDVLEMDQAGMRTQEIATELQVSESWVRRVKQEFRETGKTAPQRTRRRVKAWERHEEWLRTTVGAKPDLYLREIKALALTERGWKTSEADLCRALQVLGLTRKKRRSRRWSSIARISSRRAPSGSRPSLGSIRIGSYSLMKPGPRPT